MTTKKPNGPEKTERLEMRVDRAFLDAIDAWRREQPDLPPRATAIRRLVEEGLKRVRTKREKEWKLQ